MYKVIYHYEIDGEAKQLVSDVFMTLDEAKEYILEQFDILVERKDEYDDTSRLPEGRSAEIVREVVERNYSIEFDTSLIR